MHLMKQEFERGKLRILSSALSIHSIQPSALIRRQAHSGMPPKRTTVKCCLCEQEPFDGDFAGKILSIH